MGSYALSKKAVADLSAIWNYTVDVWSEKQADKYYFMLLSFCQDLADGKIAGKKYSMVEEDLLGFRAGKHVIFYQQETTRKIFVVRFLHTSMDIKSRMEDG
ncbi:type II toxin-antitoxin system RelE/ParE family toxin [Phnomibacter sp. MR]|uniref:type II toxin-antitoxin system RelE/ParE family toxin n=1 Tax=Phnomibacter sp. MR TaxID=3042318 RepID=UPI003A7FCD90